MTDLQDYAENANQSTVVPNQAELAGLAAELGRRLMAAGLVCATAESCTGGLICHLLTETPGSSAYFAGGAVVYSNDAKERVLAVRHDFLVDYGAVSQPVAHEMARGALRLYAADLVVAVTGIAGPDGGSAEKPVGTVHMYLAAADGTERGERFIWRADRSGNKLLSAQVALQMMISYVSSKADRSQSDGLPGRGT